MNGGSASALQKKLVTCLSTKSKTCWPIARKSECIWYMRVALNGNRNEKVGSWTRTEKRNEKWAAWRERKRATVAHKHDRVGGMDETIKMRSRACLETMAKGSPTKKASAATHPVTLNVPRKRAERKLAAKVQTLVRQSGPFHARFVHKC